MNKTAPVPERPRGKNMYEISWYYEENREAILKDLDIMGEKEMFKRWDISQATWNGLKCRWRPEIYGPGKSKTHREYRPETTPKKERSISPEYFAGYQQCVLDGAPKISK